VACGTPLDAPGAEPASTPSSPAEPVVSVAATAPAAAPPVKSGGGCLKIVAILLCIFAVLVIAVIGGLYYLGHRVAQNLEGQTDKAEKGSLAQKVKDLRSAAQTAKGLAGTLAPERTVNAEPCPAVQPSHSQGYRKTAASASIPFKPGLALISIWTNPEKNAHDLESMDRIGKIDDNSVEVQLSTMASGHPEFPSSGSRTLCVNDLLNGRQYETAWGDESGKLGGIPATIPGATMFSMSQAVFQDLKAGRPAGFEYYEAHEIAWSTNQYGISHDFTTQLQRVEPDDVPVSVIVNGEPKDLPTIHVRGATKDGDTMEANILDDAANPLTLHFASIKSKTYITYVKINWPEQKIEKELAQGCAALYGVYFDFDSARLRPESAPQLKEIAGALQHHPEWKIRIEGHTDNIGGDAYNLTLSQERAAAVGSALASGYGIRRDRLSSEGFGAGRPKATNDTVEGRALNRRVELCRQ